MKETGFVHASSTPMVTCTMDSEIAIVAGVNDPKPRKKQLKTLNNVPNGNAHHEAEHSGTAEGIEQKASNVDSVSAKSPRNRNPKNTSMLVDALKNGDAGLETSTEFSSTAPPDRRYLPHETFRQQFWLLSNSSATDPRVLEQATLGIIQHVRNEYKKLLTLSGTNSSHAPSTQKNTFVEDLHYTLMRLVGGLASPRSADAFASALTLLLAEPYIVDVPLGYLLDVIHETLSTTTTTKLTDDEIKHLNDGLLLAYSVLCNTTLDSELWQKAEASQILITLRKLRELSEIKASYRTIADQLFASLLVRITHGNRKSNFNDALRQCYPDEYEALHANLPKADWLTDRMLFVAGVGAKCGHTQMLDHLVSHVEKSRMWQDVANLLRVGWLEESQPLPVERLTIPACLIVEYLIQQDNIDHFSQFWTALCETSPHQDGRVTGKTRFTFLLASFLLSCVGNDADTVESNAGERTSQIIQIVLSDSFVDLCVKCIKLDHSSAGKSGALVRLCETADEFIKDLIQFLRSLRNSTLIYTLLVNWFERTWKTLTKTDEASVIVPLVAGLQWQHIVQFTDLLVDKFNSVEKKANKHRRQPTPGTTSSDDESSATQQSVSLVLRQRLLYLIGLSLTSQVNKQPAITLTEWNLCQKPLRLLTRLTCSAEKLGETSNDEDASLHTVARRELLCIMHRLNESHHRNKLFSSYAESRLALLKAVHIAVAAQTNLQLSEPNETRRMELESVLKKLNKNLRVCSAGQSAADKTKAVCLTFAVLLAEKAYCDWQFLSTHSCAVDDVLEGCRNILHNVGKKDDEATVAESDGEVKADYVDVAVDLILSLLLASKKEQDFLRICFASLAPVLADRHIHKLVDASLDSFGMPADEEEDDDADADDDDAEDDDEEVDADEDEDDAENADETENDNQPTTSESPVHQNKQAGTRKRDISAADTEKDDDGADEALLSDTEMLALDDQLAATFRMRIAEKKRREQEQAFPQNVLQLLLDAAVNADTTAQQHFLLITTLIEVIAQPSPVASMPDKQGQWRKYVTQAALILGAFQQRRGDAEGELGNSEEVTDEFSPKQLAITASEACARLIFLRDSAHLSNGMNAVFYMLRILHRCTGDAAPPAESEDDGKKNQTMTTVNKKQISIMRAFFKHFLEFIGVQKTSHANASAADSNKNSSVNSADFLLQRVGGWLSQNGYGNSVVLPTLAQQALGKVNNTEADVLTDYRRAQFIQLLTTLTNLAITSAAASAKQQQPVDSDNKSEWMRDFTAVAECYAVFLSQVAVGSTPSTATSFIHKRWFITALAGLDQILRKLIAVSTVNKNQQKNAAANNTKTSSAAKSLSAWVQSTGEMLRSLCDALNMMQKAAVDAAATAQQPTLSLTPPLSIADEEADTNEQADVDMETVPISKKQLKKQKSAAKKNEPATLGAKTGTVAKETPAAMPKKVRALTRRLKDDVTNLLAMQQK